MNKLKITRGQINNQQQDSKLFNLDISNAANILPALRSDHFVECEIILSGDLQQKDLKFLMHVPRLLTDKTQLQISGQSKEVAAKLLKNLGMHQLQSSSENKQSILLSKKLPQKMLAKTNGTKLAIGMSKLANQEEIDEDQLLKDQNIDLSKPKYENCSDKPRACANCSCGRKQNEQLPTKQEIVTSVNDGKMLSGCGKCTMGDSFRCGTCPYKGLPAFKPGDRLQLTQEGKIVVEEGGVVINNGKVKLEL